MMKKVLSLLLAAVMAFGLSTVALAATDDIVFSDSTPIRPGVRVSHGTSGGWVAFVKDELLIVDDKNRIITPEYHLDPGETYEFKIYRALSNIDDIDPANAESQMAPVTALDLGGGKFRMRAVKGTSTISSAKIEKKGGGNNATYKLVLNTKENWGTKLTEVEYNLTSQDQNNESTTISLQTGNLTFKVGYGQYTDEDIDDFSEGDIISITDEKTVILKKQFSTLAKNYNYKNIQFEADDGSWTYEGKVSGMSDTNFTYSQDVIPSIVQKFEDQDFKFLTFGAGVNFPTNGEMRIDVSDVSGDFTRMFTYLYRNGKLTPISTTYDSGADEIVFRTNFLGAFVMTDEEITDRTIIEQGGSSSSSAESGNENNGGNQNPGTGTTGGVATAAMLGIASLAAAAAVVRKKK